MQTEQIAVASTIGGLVLLIVKLFHYVFATGKQVGEVKTEVRLLADRFAAMATAQNTTNSRIDEIYRLLSEK